MTKSLVSMAMVALVAVAGKVACSGPAGSPSRRPEVSPPGDWQRIGTWDSATAGLPPARVSILGGRLIGLRARCSGSGELTVRVHTATFEVVNGATCNGRWRLAALLFPPGGASPSPDPIRRTSTDRAPSPPGSWRRTTPILLSRRRQGEAGGRTVSVTVTGSAG